MKFDSELGDKYGEVLSDDFMNGIYEFISQPSSEWPYEELWEGDELYIDKWICLIKFYRLRSS